MFSRESSVRTTKLRNVFAFAVALDDLMYGDLSASDVKTLIEHEFPGESFRFFMYDKIDAMVEHRMTKIEMLKQISNAYGLDAEAGVGIEYNMYNDRQRYTNPNAIQTLTKLLKDCGVRC